MNSQIVLIGIFLALIYVFTAGILGFQYGMLASVILTIAVLALLKYANIKMFSAFPLSRQGALYAFIVLGVLFAYMTGMLSMVGLGTGVSASFIPATTYSPPTTTTGVTTTGACSVSEATRGLGSTIDIITYDKEAATATSVTGVTYTLFQDGVKKSTTTTSSGTTAIGSLIDLYNQSQTYTQTTTYLVDPKTDICVSDARPTVTIDAHKLVNQTGLAITAYDDSGATALTAGDVNDYKLTVGASETKTIYLKLKNNEANVAFNFDGWAVAYNNLTSVKPISDEKGGVYSQDITPLFMKGIRMHLNTSAAITESNALITVDYTPFVRNAPLLMHQWDSFKTQFEIKSTSVNPADVSPAQYNSTSNSSLVPVYVSFVAFDAGWYSDSSDVFKMTYYTPDTSLANVGMAESYASSVGKDNSMLLEIE